MKKYYLILSEGQQRYEFDSLDEAAARFAQCVSSNCNCSLVVVTEQVIGSFRKEG